MVTTDHLHKEISSSEEPALILSLGKSASLPGCSVIKQTLFKDCYKPEISEE
jgi:hypothetical protein